MAEIKKRGDTYKISVYVGRDINGKKIRKSTTFTPNPLKTEKQNQKELQAFVYDFEKRVKDGTYLDGENLTYSKYIEIWLEKYAKQQMAVTSYERTKDILDKIVLKHLGQYKLKDIKPLMIKAIYDEMQATGYIRHGKKVDYAQSTIARVHNTISITFSTAVYWQLIESNPCSRIKPPKTFNKKEVKCFTVEEAIAFLDFIKKPYTYTNGGRYEIDGKMVDNTSVHTFEVPYQYQVFFNLALYGGFRRGELYGLNWSDIDFKNNTISVTKSLAETSDGTVLKTPKNETSVRTVTIPQSCIDMLIELKEQRREMFSTKQIIWIEGNTPVFINEEGKSPNMKRANELFKDIIKRYNEENNSKLPNISLHGLRHTCATLLISQGIDIKEVSSRLGHSNTSTTLDIYTHALQKRDIEASNVLEQLLACKSV